jgi:hypothetical protein
MTLEVTWHDEDRNRNIPGPPIESETITLSATAAESGVAPKNARYVFLQATEACRYAWGTAPEATDTAGANGHYLAAGTSVWLPAYPGKTKISGIQPDS